MPTITNIADLQAALAAGTLERLQGIGPAALRDISSGVEWVRESVTV